MKIGKAPGYDGYQESVVNSQGFLNHVINKRTNDRDGKKNSESALSYACET